MPIVRNRIGLKRFELLPKDEKDMLLSRIESALMAKFQRGQTTEDMELAVVSELDVANSIVKIVSGSKKFKNKLESRRM